MIRRLALILASVTVAGSAAWLTFSLRMPTESLKRLAIPTSASQPASVVALAASVRHSNPPPAALNLPPLTAVLVGTLLDAKPEANVAVILEHPQNLHRRFVRVGELVQERAVTMIGRGIVTLRRPDGRLDILTMQANRAPEGVIQPLEKDAFRVDRQRLNDTLHGNVLQLLTHADVRPHLENFKFTGVEVGHVKPSGLAAQAGLRDGDVVSRVNDVSLESMPAVLSAYYHARRSGEVTLQLTRQGQPRTLRYVME